MPSERGMPYAQLLPEPMPFMRLSMPSDAQTQSPELQIYNPQDRMRHAHMETDTACREMP